jgi:hypothetical protein
MTSTNNNWENVTGSTGGNWDNVVSYSQFWLETKCSANAKISVYQSNTNSEAFSIVDTFNYVGNNTPINFSGQIQGSGLKVKLDTSLLATSSLYTIYKSSGGGATGAGVTGPTGPTGATGATGSFSPTGTNYSDYIYWNSNTNAWEVGNSEVHIGENAGSTGQQFEAVAIGKKAGYIDQRTGAIAIGSGAGSTNQGQYSVAIGRDSGNINQGLYSVAIGYGAGNADQPDNTIVLNATSSNFSPTGPTGAFYVNPVRNATGENILYFNSNSNEITYGNVNVNPTTNFLLGNVARVDDVNGNDSTAVIGGSPFKTVQSAISAINATGTTGLAIWVLPGTYDLSPTGITIPNYTALRGMSLQTCTLQISGATGDTTLITMGENCRVEDLTMNLTSNEHHKLVGIEFPGNSSVTSKLRTSVITVRNSAAGPTGTSDVYGVLSSGTGTLGPASFSFNSLKSSTINVYSNGAGKKRGILVDNSNIVTTRDLNVYVAAPTDVSSTGSYVGCEVDDRNGVTGTGAIQFRSTTLGTTTPSYVGPTGTIQAYTASDILQSTPTGILNPDYLASPGIQVGPGTDLVTKTAGGRGFSTYIYPTTIYYGLKGGLTGASGGWLWPGTQAVSNNNFPDPSGSDGNILLTVSGCTSGTNQISVSPDPSAAGLTGGMPIVFSDNYGYIKEGAVLGVPAVNPYYIFDVPDSTHIRIGTYVANALTLFNPGTYNSSQTVATVYTKTVTATRWYNSGSGGNANKINMTTTGLAAGMPIIFREVIGADITVGTVYWIKALTTAGGNPAITISNSYNGPVKVLTGDASEPINVIGNIVTISSAPAYYGIQQPAILSGMAAFLARPPNTDGATGSSTTLTVYRTPVGSDYQFGLCPVANYTKTFSGTDLLQTYYDSSKTFSARDRIHVYLSYTGASNTSHDLTVQLDMF